MLLPHHREGTSAAGGSRSREKRRHEEWFQGFPEERPVLRARCEGGRQEKEAGGVKAENKKTGKKFKAKLKMRKIK